MQIVARLVLSLLIALAIAVPSVGGEGGENAGGTGVWILPRSSCLSGSLAPVATGSESRTVTDFSTDLVLLAGEECGDVIATATSSAISATIALPVSGHEVVLPRSVLQSLRAAGVTGLTIVIADEQNQGYVIAVTGLSTNSATFRIR